MAIRISLVRTPAMNERNAKADTTYDSQCLLCLRLLPKGPSSRAISFDHESGEFVTPAEIIERGPAVSGFLVGPDCYKRIERKLAIQLANRSSRRRLRDFFICEEAKP